jgi:prolyl-tRNA synthetase
MHHYLPNGRVIEGTCFHYDGENFAKAYDIKFKDKNEKKNSFIKTLMQSQRECLEQCSLCIQTTRACIPPRLAENKVVIIPLLFKGKEKRFGDF